ncbi:unnamed protein product [Amoebophrya sp. A120]|nr:unnamed protein product [Amoebophrya sp. A120]|eukprot:GSA120T00019163001.1
MNGKVRITMSTSVPALVDESDTIVPAVAARPNSSSNTGDYNFEVIAFSWGDNTSKQLLSTATSLSSSSSPSLSNFYGNKSAIKNQSTTTPTTDQETTSTSQHLTATKIDHLAGNAEATLFLKNEKPHFVGRNILFREDEDDTEYFEEQNHARIDLEEFQNIKVAALAAGDQHFLALSDQGFVFSWACNNEFGQCGRSGGVSTKKQLPQVVNFGKSNAEVMRKSFADGTKTHLIVPAPTYNFSSTISFRAKQIACGENHSLILTEAGEVYSFGSNVHGQCGIYYSSQDLHRAVASYAKTPGNDSIQQDGSCSSQLILNETLTPNFYALPDNVDFLRRNPHYKYPGPLLGPHVQFSNSWNEKNFSPAASPPLTIETPMRVEGRLNSLPVRQIACGRHHSLAVSISGNAFSWGSNRRGQLGSGDDSIKKSFHPQPVFLSHNNCRSLAGGGQHSAFVLFKGSLFLCGDNSFGQLGQDVNEIATTSVPLEVPFGDNYDLYVRGVSLGDRHSIALSVDNKIFAWGRNVEGQVTGMVDRVEKMSEREVGAASGMNMEVDQDASNGDNKALGVDENTTTSGATTHFDMVPWPVHIPLESLCRPSSSQGSSGAADGANVGASGSTSQPALVSSDMRVREIFAVADHTIVLAEREIVADDEEPVMRKNMKNNGDLDNPDAIADEDPVEELEVGKKDHEGDIAMVPVQEVDSSTGITTSKRRRITRGSATIDARQADEFKEIAKKAFETAMLSSPTPSAEILAKMKNSSKNQSAEQQEKDSALFTRRLSRATSESVKQLRSNSASLEGATSTTGGGGQTTARTSGGPNTTTATGGGNPSPNLLSIMQPPGFEDIQYYSSTSRAGTNQGEHQGDTGTGMTAASAPGTTTTASTTSRILLPTNGAAAAIDQAASSSSASGSAPSRPPVQLPPLGELQQQEPAFAPRSRSGLGSAGINNEEIPAANTTADHVRQKSFKRPLQGDDQLHDEEASGQLTREKDPESNFLPRHFSRGCSSEQADAINKLVESDKALQLPHTLSAPRITANSSGSSVLYQKHQQHNTILAATTRKNKLTLPGNSESIHFYSLENAFFSSFAASTNSLLSANKEKEILEFEQTLIGAFSRPSVLSCCFVFQGLSTPKLDVDGFIAGTAEIWNLLGEARRWFSNSIGTGPRAAGLSSSSSFLNAKQPPTSQPFNHAVLNGAAAPSFSSTGRPLNVVQNASSASSLAGSTSAIGVVHPASGNINTTEINEEQLELRSNQNHPVVAAAAAPGGPAAGANAMVNLVNVNNNSLPSVVEAADEFEEEQEVELLDRKQSAHVPGISDEIDNDVSSDGMMNRSGNLIEDHGDNHDPINAAAGSNFSLVEQRTVPEQQENNPQELTNNLLPAGLQLQTDNDFSPHSAPLLPPSSNKFEYEYQKCLLLLEETVFFNWLFAIQQGLERMQPSNLEKRDQLRTLVLYLLCPVWDTAGSNLDTELNSALENNDEQNSLENLYNRLPSLIDITRKTKSDLARTLSGQSASEVVGGGGGGGKKQGSTTASDMLGGPTPATAFATTATSSRVPSGTSGNEEDHGNVAISASNHPPTRPALVRADSSNEGSNQQETQRQTPKATQASNSSEQDQLPSPADQHFTAIEKQREDLLVKTFKLLMKTIMWLPKPSKIEFLHILRQELTAFAFEHRLLKSMQRMARVMYFKKGHFMEKAVQTHNGAQAYILNIDESIWHHVYLLDMIYVSALPYLAKGKIRRESFHLNVLLEPKPPEDDENTADYRRRGARSRQGTAAGPPAQGAANQNPNAGAAGAHQNQQGNPNMVGRGGAAAAAGFMSFPGSAPGGGSTSSAAPSSTGPPPGGPVLGGPPAPNPQMQMSNHIHRSPSSESNASAGQTPTGAAAGTTGQHLQTVSQGPQVYFHTLVPPEADLYMFAQYSKNKPIKPQDFLDVSHHFDKANPFCGVPRQIMSFIAHPHLCPTKYKQKVLEVQNAMQHELVAQRSMQQGLITALASGNLDPHNLTRDMLVALTHFVLEVRRDNLVHDCFRELEKATEADLQRPLKIKFKGEEGLDDGGLTKEFFRLLSTEVFSAAYGMFQEVEGTRAVWFNLSAYDVGLTAEDFKNIGKILGLAVYNNVQGLNLNFPKLFFKKLVSEPVDRTIDLEQIYPTYATSIDAILNWRPSPADLPIHQANQQFDDTFCLDFSVSYKNAFDQNITVELCENGLKKTVNYENREYFVDLLSEFLLNKQCEKFVDPLKQGFQTVCNERSAIAGTLFSDELQLIVGGERVLDFDALKEGTTYIGFDRDSDFIKNFWSVLRNYSLERKRAFLDFVTGSDIPPIGGLKELQLKIQKNGEEPTTRLPTSHTCYNILLLPEYSSRTKLDRLLRIAISNAEGFGME